MNHKSLVTWMTFAFAGCGFTRLALAQETTPPSHIAYRLVEAKTIHFDDPQKYAAHTEQVRKLGCEVSQGAHAGHGDVTYRCLKWKALTVADDKLAHQWEEWLEAAGFETLHGHSESERHEHEEAHDHDHAGHTHEEVIYQLPNWLTLHPQNENEAQEVAAIFKGLGCELRESRHEAHVDIAIRCPQQMHIEVESHEAAEFWHGWLTKTGFVAEHED